MLAFVPLMAPCRSVTLAICLLQQNTHSKSTHLAKPNFQYEKRQKELEKKRKKEEKLKRKAEKGSAPDDGTDTSDVDADDAEDGADTDATGPAAN